VHFEAIRSERGCVSYLIGCEKTRAAIVVDPTDEQIDRYLALAASHGLRIRYLLDTHTHADHFSAVSELRDQLGVPTIMHRSSPAPFIDVHAEDGETIIVGELRLGLIHTPGHTSDHFCLHDPTENVFLAGDHVLPTITPHISGIASSPDPLASFFYSLDRVAEIQGVSQVLPAHGHPFDDLPARTEAIKRHHMERLDKVRAISRDLGPSTVQAFSRQLFKPRSWGAMAESETYAHLEHLRIAGNAERHEGDDGRLVYQTG